MDKPTRACAQCGLVKPENGTGSRPTRCRDCFNAWRRIKRAKARLAPPPNRCGLYPLGEKVCAHCGEAKRPWEFPRDARLPHGLCALCKPCVWEKNRASYAKHREKRLATGAVRRTPQVLEVARAASAQWRLDNPEHAAFLRQRTKARRRTREGVAPRVRFTHVQLAARVAYFGGKCWMCGARYEHMDHVKPIAAGGSDMLSNLRPACAPCNFAKNGKWYGVAELHRFLR